MTSTALRHRLAATMAALVLGGVAPLAAADWKPDKPVTLIVPYAAGGGVDATARFVAAELQKKWGQSVVIDNQGGADGLIGTRRAIQAKPDGHTLLVQIPSITLSAHAPGFKGVDPIKELIPVTEFAKLYGVVAVSTKIPGKTFGEVVAHCKTATTPCSFGTTEHSARLRAQQMSSYLPTMVIVNYKGGGQLITDLVSQRLDMAIMGYTAAIPHLKAGSIKVVMTVGKNRSPLMPDVPAATESGFPELESATWYGLFAPLGTPPEVVESISAAVREAVKEPGLQNAFANLGGVAVGSTPSQFATAVREAAENWGALARRYPLQ